MSKRKSTVQRNVKLTPQEIKLIAHVREKLHRPGLQLTDQDVMRIALANYGQGLLLPR